MLRLFVLASIVFMLSTAWAQGPTPPPQPDAIPPFGSASSGSALNSMFQTKIHAEWEALKTKDKKAYGDLLADDYQGVQIDGRGERNKVQSVNDLDETNSFNYTLERFKTISLGPDAALVIYESTMQFPPRAQLRYSRVYITELWVKRGGEWKELHYQETHVK
jgi:hypothetical protein